MKKLSILILTLSLALMFTLTPKAHAYTLSNIAFNYYNQTTTTVGQSEVLDIDSTYIEYMYFNLGNDTLPLLTSSRVVFSNTVTTSLLELPSNIEKTLTVTIRFYNSSNVMLFERVTPHPQTQSFSYFETNFQSSITSISGIDYITISITNLSIGYDEDIMHSILNGAIISRGNTIINQTIGTAQYTNGWNDAMNSKVTQIWSLWGNIFDTFMSVFDIFSITLVGDITIGHIALVPLVLGLIGFIYALGGKRGR